MENEIDKLNEQIEIKKEEIRLLEYKTEKIVNEQYNYLIGKCYSTSGSSIICVTGVRYDGDDELTAEGIVIYGGDGNNSDFSIDLDGCAHLDLNYMPNEISKEEFMEIYKKWNQNINNVLLEKI
jgi:hypothetical protein